MRKYILYVCILVCLPTSLIAINNLRLPDIRSMSTGGNGVTQSVYYNPALISQSDKRQIDIHYYNRYGLKELGSINGSFQYPNPVLSASLQVTTFGYDQYRESMFRLAVGKQLGEEWGLGISVQYLLLQTELFEERPAWLATDIGATFRPFDKLLIGMLIMNAPTISVGDKTADINDITDYSIHIGIEWEVINNVLIMGSIGGEEDKAMVGSIGIEYTAFDTFHIRSGIQINPLIPCFGLGYDLSAFTIDAVATWHSVLGVSLGLGLSYSF